MLRDVVSASVIFIIGGFFMSEIIVKVLDAARQKHLLNKITGNIALSSLVELIQTLDLEANPRLAKKGPVTDDIQESLVTEAEVFHFMSKGILIAAASVDELERNRFKLQFDDLQLEGILDGGHNTLAAGRQILLEVLTAEFDSDKADSVLRSIKGWRTLKEAWTTYADVLVARKNIITHALVPVEIIYPGDGANAYADFQDKVLVINAARNNNAELTEETKANKRGFYSEIRANLDPALVDEVEWKSNDGGRIKVRDLVALSLIPLSLLPFEATRQIRNSPSLIFSSKGKCIDIYGALMDDKDNGVTDFVTGNIVGVVDMRVKSALALMRDLPRLFDLIYELMPDGYNSAGGKFGKIKSVNISETKRHKSHYYRRPMDVTYGEGFIYPLVYALTSLIKDDNGILSWRTDPDKFIKEKLPEVMKAYYAMISGQDHDPAKVGKTNGAYTIACGEFSKIHKDEILKAHGLA
jgi:hypothetical protein